MGPLSSIDFVIGAPRARDPARPVPRPDPRGILARRARGGVIRGAASRAVRRLAEQRGQGCRTTSCPGSPARARRRYAGPAVALFGAAAARRAPGRARLLRPHRRRALGAARARSWRDPAARARPRCRPRPPPGRGLAQPCRARAARAGRAAGRAPRTLTSTSARLRGMVITVAARPAALRRRIDPAAVRRISSTRRSAASASGTLRTTQLLPT